MKNTVVMSRQRSLGGNKEKAGPCLTAKIYRDGSVEVDIHDPRISGRKIRHSAIYIWRAVQKFKNQVAKKSTPPLSSGPTKAELRAKRAAELREAKAEKRAAEAKGLLGIPEETPQDDLEFELSWLSEAKADQPKSPQPAASTTEGQSVKTAEPSGGKTISPALQAALKKKSTS